MGVRANQDTDALTRTTGLPSGTTYTVGGWIYLSTDRNDVSTVWGLHDGTGAGQGLGTTADGTTLGLWDDESIHTSALTLSTATWYYVGVSKSGTDATIYHASVTASALSSQGVTGLSSPTFTAFVVFDSFTSARWWDGRVGAFKVWSGASLTEAEHEVERRYVRPVRRADLLWWYPFLSFTTMTVDFSGNDGTLTTVGTPLTEDGPPVPWAPRRHARRVGAMIAYRYPMCRRV